MGREGRLNTESSFFLIKEDSVGNSRKTIQSLVKRFGKKEGLGLKIFE
jgi:hypothetical protein